MEFSLTRRIPLTLSRDYVRTVKFYLCSTAIFAPDPRKAIHRGYRAILAARDIRIPPIFLETVGNGTRDKTAVVNSTVDRPIVYND